ncbi:MAG: hypothetical protein K0S33_1642 [Bacteroidetes bacterium]|jgi:hypothetical protein|nr:hypothetical protein [Bacteroidota bacterium]
MHKNIQIVLITAFVSCFSCRPKYDPKPVFSTLNDFENVRGWISAVVNNSNTLTDVTAHSGKYSSRIDKNNQYSYSFRQQLKNLGAEPKSWVRVSMWCKYTGTIDKSHLACFITNDKEVTQLWRAIHLAPELSGKKNQWVYIEKSLDFSGHRDNDFNFNLFVSSGGGDEEVFIDDLKLEFFK